jgi:hypothetical protein
MLTEFFKQFRAEHHVAVFASLAALDVNDHPLAVDIAELQLRHLAVPGTGGVEGHQQSAMENSGGRSDELRNFFLTQQELTFLGSRGSSCPRCAPLEIRIRNL